LGPLLLVAVAMTWLFVTGALSAIGWIALTLLLALAFVPAMAMVAYMLDDARRGYRHTRELEGHLFAVVPWVSSLLILTVARLLTLIDGSQFAVAVSVLATASVPGLLYGAALNHRNRNLPYRHPREST
jgi:hypothetical protein